MVYRSALGRAHRNNRKRHCHFLRFSRGRPLWLLSRHPTCGSEPLLRRL
ncbi:unnamed protein product [Symbiodinium pilosum]|uniref:Uncharacterized protein n=1 Tax=Symbiodinium pilosum TaxID=2952 RepID=A0A812MUN5_SYMPI|nr:unnamed protein product [Symbiodinium pilosum]